MSRLAHIKPAACSVCLQPPNVRDPQPRYVDFEAAYDGPVLTHAGEELRPENYNRTSIDDLFICEECLKPAAELIGMSDGEEARARIAQLEAEAAEKDKEIAAKDRAVAELNYTVGYLIDSGAVNRGKGKPHLRGPETHEAEIKELRSDLSIREREAKKRRPKAAA